MRKFVIISDDVDSSINEILALELKFSGKQSYSKILNYLVVLGIDKYNELVRNTGQQITSPDFDFSKHTRHIKPKEVQP